MTATLRKIDWPSPRLIFKLWLDAMLPLIIKEFLLIRLAHWPPSTRRAFLPDELDEAFVKEDPSAEIAYLSVNHW